MFGKKINIASAVFLCILLLAGCENAPERMQSNDTDTEMDFSSEQYVLIGEAGDQLRKLEGKNIQGFYFPEQIGMPDIQKIAEVKLTPWHSEQKEDLEAALKNCGQTMARRTGL